MQPMMRWVAFGIAAFVVGGCSGSGGSAPATSPTVSTNSVVATTVATSTPPPSSTSTTVAASTTTLPATTTTVATEDLIKKAVLAYAAAYHACGEAPATCVPSDFTAEQGRSRSTVTELATGMAQQGLYFSTDRRGSYLVAESVSIGSSTQASAIYCVFDAGAVMGPIGPDGQATVVNDVVASVRYTFTLFLDVGTWLVGEQQQIERLGEGSLCPPSA